MADFERHIDELVRKEGGYRETNIAGDRGGRTYAGISFRAHPNWEGWAMLDRGAPPSELQGAVHRLYKLEYWDALRLDDIHSDEAAEMLFGACVHNGQRAATVLAQQAVEAKVDGIIGPETLVGINRMDEALFECRFALAAINRYRTICNRDRTQVKFLLGWLNRVYGELES